MKRPELRIRDEAFAGRRFAVPAGGLRVGRSSSNDIPVHDEELSRNHCLFEQAGEDGIRVTDLASANGTFVNGVKLGSEAVTLKPGDVIRVGSTSIDVVGEGADGDGIDLGLGERKEGASTIQPPTANRPPSRNLRPLLWSVTILALGVAAWLLYAPTQAPAARTAHEAAETRPVLTDMRYESVTADAKAIFRYCLTFEADGTLHVVIDDTSDNRHTDKRVALGEKARAELTDILADADFAALRGEYRGPDEEPPKLVSRRLAYFTRETCRDVSVVNTLEPNAFRIVREKLETFAENELGIHAWNYSREDLLRMAHEAGDAASMKWEDRDVEHGNLHAAISSYRRALAYLETLNPKPPEFATYAAAIERAEKELETRYRNLRFDAEQAMSTGDWERARDAFRTLREMVPDAEDERNHEAKLKLIDIEKRLGRKGGR